jgi:UDP-N-acetyl-D-glucosamine dehydrogenase
MQNDELRNKFTIAVIGQGYVGLPLAIAFSKVFDKVIGIEVDESRAKSLLNGHSFTEDVSVNELNKALRSGRFRIESRFECLAQANVVIICVPTPLTSEGQPDLEAVESCIDQMAEFVPDGTLIVNESTSYPGTLREFIAKKLYQLRSKEGLLFASAPERIDPGNRFWELKNTPRIVAGIDKDSTDLVVQLYRAICDEVIVVDTPEIAEMAKLLENTFRQVNIALVNQISEFCSASSIDVFKVVEAASTKPYGFMPFYPGAGVGGHCIPVDPMYLYWRSAQLGINLDLISKAQFVNQNRPSVITQKLRGIIPEASKSILLVGMGYKSGVGDLRHSPAQEIYSQLAKVFEKVNWFDPRINHSLVIGKTEGLYDFEVYIVFDYVLFKSIESKINSNSLILDCSGRGRTLGSIKVI